MTLPPATRSAAWRAFARRPLNVRVTDASGLSLVTVPIMSEVRPVLREPQAGAWFRGPTGATCRDLSGGACSRRTTDGISPRPRSGTAPAPSPAGGRCAHTRGRGAVRGGGGGGPTCRWTPGRSTTGPSAIAGRVGPARERTRRRECLNPPRAACPRGHAERIQTKPKYLACTPRLMASGQVVVVTSLTARPAARRGGRPLTLDPARGPDQSSGADGAGSWSGSRPPRVMI